MPRDTPPEIQRAPLQVTARSLLMLGECCILCCILCCVPGLPLQALESPAIPLSHRKSSPHSARCCAVLCCTALLQGLVLDVKGILGARTDVPALLAQMITPPEPAALLQGVEWLCWTAALLDCFVAVHN